MTQEAQAEGVAKAAVEPLTDLTSQSRLLAERRVSSVELVDLCLRRIEATQPELNCFRVVCEEEARSAAEAADERRSVGEGEHLPLLGVPVAVKDDVDVAGQSTPFGCGGEHRVASADAEMVQRLRRAGAIVVGKTNAPEVGQWPFTESLSFGQTRNPWDLDHTPGGSSGGAGAAVAAGLVGGAIGSDGAGSVRIPAAWTGLVGLKPQRGRISTWPDPDAFNGLACFGPLTRSVADAALLLDAVSGNHREDLHRPPPVAVSFSTAIAEPPPRLRIALSFATPFGVPDKVDPEIRAAVERTAEQLGELGHEILREDPSYGLVGLGIVPRGMGGVHGWLEEHLPDGAELEPRTRLHGRLGGMFSGLPLRAARAAEPRMRRRIARTFERSDVILTPTTALPPPRIGAGADRGYWATSSAAGAACPFAWAWNVTGWPGLSIPAGFTSGGLPIGAQLLGRENDEATLLALGAELEAAAADGDWRERRPPILESLEGMPALGS
jgi:amidase